MENEVKDRINGHSKPMSKKKKIIFIVSVLAVLLTTIIGIVVWCVTLECPAIPPNQLNVIEYSVY